MHNSEQRQLAILVFVIALASAFAAAEDRPSAVAPGTKLTKIEGRFDFTEGPVTDVKGNVYFSDVRPSRTFRWSANGKVETSEPFAYQIHGNHGKIWKAWEW